MLGREGGLKTGRKFWKQMLTADLGIDCATSLMDTPRRGRQGRMEKETM